MKLIVFTTPRTGSHLISRAVAAKGYTCVHEPFEDWSKYQDYEQFIETVVAPTENIVVFDHWFADGSQQGLGGPLLHDYKNCCIKDFDKAVVLLRRDTFQQALSISYALHPKNQFNNDWSSTNRPSVILDPSDVWQHYIRIKKASKILVETRLPTFYYEDILENSNQFPIKLTIEDYRPPKKSDYIINYKELRFRYKELRFQYKNLTRYKSQFSNW